MGRAFKPAPFSCNILGSRAGPGRPGRGTGGHPHRMSPEGSPAMLNCTTHEVGGILVITLEDAGQSVDDRQSSHRETLYKLVQSRQDSRFAVDLSSLDYITSADIGFLISLRRRVDAMKGKVIFFGISAYIRDTLATMRLLPLFPLADDLDAAIEQLPPNLP